MLGNITQDPLGIDPFRFALKLGIKTRGVYDRSGNDILIDCWTRMTAFPFEGPDSGQDGLSNRTLAGDVRFRFICR